MRFSDYSYTSQLEALRSLIQNATPPFELTLLQLEEMDRVAHSLADWETLALYDEMLCRWHGIFYEDVEKATGRTFRKQLKARIRMMRRD